MIAKFHEKVKLPVLKGTPLNFGFDIRGRPYVKKVKPGDKHFAFAAENLTSREVIISAVLSPVYISLVSNFQPTAP